MSEKSKERDKSGKVEKASKKSSNDGRRSKEHKQTAAASAYAFALLADDKTVDPTLSSLFAVKQPPVKAKLAPPKEPRVIITESSDEKDEAQAEDEDNDAELSEIDEDLDDEEVPKDDSGPIAESESSIQRTANESEDGDAKSKRKRKRKAADEELEDVYMGKLAREEQKEAQRLAAERVAKRQKTEAQAESADESDRDEEATTGADVNGAGVELEDDREAMSPPPKHETQQQADDDLSKANRTVFLSNVSTDAISSKSSRKTLLKHLGSFFDKLTDPKAGDAKPKVESIRFRSTPYASAIPKKAAFAKKELMDATTKSTNAYAVYSSPILAREAAKRLNGTIVLDRHIRVDEVAHPAKVDNRRCIFVGNLGFVDDESNIQDANEEDGREKRKRGKEPADIEEGLWRTFGKCGKVESVRVIRDSTTRVGKGIAYVQFEDENAVEAALLYNEKKFPPMLPRKMRVSRAKAQKRNPKPGSDRPAARKASATGGYQRKITGEEASKMGRASKLLGRAGAAQMRSSNGPTTRPREQEAGASAPVRGIQKPEAFIFEGHRASSKQGKSGLKLGGKHNKTSGGKKTKVTSRSSAFKAKKKAAT